MTTYLSPATSTLPDLTGTGIAFMPFAYMASANVLDPDRVKSRLKCVAGQWPDAKGVWDADAVDEFAAHQLAGGRDTLMFDHELPDTDAERATYLRIMWRLADRGLKVSRWGCDPDGAWDRLYAGANNSGYVFAAYYNYTSNPAVWEADRTRRIKQVRQAWPNRKVGVVLCPYHEQIVDGDAQSPLAHQYVGKEMWGRQLALCRALKVDAVVAWYSNVLPSGALGPFDPQAEWFVMLKDFARTH